MQFNTWYLSRLSVSNGRQSARLHPLHLLFVDLYVDCQLHIVADNCVEL